MENLKLKMLLLNENTKIVWNPLGFETESTYGELMEKTGLRRSTLYDALCILEKAGFVNRTKDKPDGSGRPKIRWLAI